METYLADIELLKLQEQTKQIEEQTKQIETQEKTKQLQLELDILKLKTIKQQVSHNVNIRKITFYLNIYR